MNRISAFLKTFKFNQNKKDLYDNSNPVNRIIDLILKEYNEYEKNLETIKIISKDNFSENIRINLYKNQNKQIFHRICILLSKLEIFIKNIKYNEIQEDDLKQMQHIIDKIKCKNDFKKFDIKNIVNCTSCKKYNNLIIQKEKDYCNSSKKSKIQKELKILDSLKIKHCKELCNTCIKLLDNYDKVLSSKEKGFAGNIQKNIRSIVNNIGNSSQCKNSYNLCNDLDSKINNSNNNDYKKMLKKQSISLGCNKILNSRYYNEEEEKVDEELEKEYAEIQSEISSSFRMNDDDFEKMIDDVWDQMEREEEYSKLLEETKIKNPEYFTNKKIKRKIKKYCKKNNCDIDEIINIMNNMKISKKQLENNTDTYLTEIFKNMKL